jgi:lipopolysaccharide export system protein LptC
MNHPVTANAIDLEPRGWTASRRSDLDSAVRTAGRHSRLVRVVRVGLPIAVVGALATLVFVTYFQPMQIFDSMPKVSGKLAVQGSKITMELPRIAGFTRDSRPYEFTAETAVQDVTTPDVVELANLRASMEMQDKDKIRLSAKGGTYNTKGDSIILRDQIVVTSEQGYSARLREAAVDIKKGNVVSEQPVEVTLPTGLLKANRLEIINSGDLIRFDRGVVLTLDASPAGGAKQ